MNITNSYNPEEKRVLVFVESNLLTDYFPNFQGLLKKNNSSIDDLRVERLGNSKAMISFPLPKEAQVMQVDQQKIGVSMPVNIIEEINNTINKFANAAVRKRLRTVEFLPLSNYPEENLKEDMINAVKAKRDFVILQDYNDYLQMEKEKRYDFSQILMYYGTEEYADAALNIWEGNIDSLKNRLEGKFERYEWI